MRGVAPARRSLDNGQAEQCDAGTVEKLTDFGVGGIAGRIIGDLQRQLGIARGAGTGSKNKNNNGSSRNGNGSSSKKKAGESRKKRPALKPKTTGKTKTRRRG